MFCAVPYTHPNRQTHQWTYTLSTNPQIHITCMLQQRFISLCVVIGFWMKFGPVPRLGTQMHIVLPYHTPGTANDIHERSAKGRPSSIQWCTTLPKMCSLKGHAHEQCVFLWLHSHIQCFEDLRQYSPKFVFHYPKYRALPCPFKTVASKSAHDGYKHILIAPPRLHARVLKVVHSYLVFDGSFRFLWRVFQCGGRTWKAHVLRSLGILKSLSPKPPRRRCLKGIHFQLGQMVLMFFIAL